MVLYYKASRILAYVSIMFYRRFGFWDEEVRSFNVVDLV